MTTMTTAVLSPGRKSGWTADGALKAAATTWLTAAIIGQAMFLFYILALYGLSTLSGNFQTWALNTNLITGYVPGDTAGNLAFGAHVLMAAVITFGGTLQLTPQIRARAPAVHRWTGRLFMITAIGASLAGLYMTWARVSSSPLTDRIAISIDAVLIISFAALAWRGALTRDFASHRRWAMRTFMVANGVWFLRLGFVAFGILSSAAGASDSGLARAFFSVWTFGCYLVPLAVLELYLLAKDRAGPAGKASMAIGLFGLTAVMSLGVVGAWFGVFAPVLAKL
jgi:hypothetical protein